MTSLYNIITEAKAASGSKEKTAVLMKYKDNMLLKSYLKMVNDPSLSYFIATCPEPNGNGSTEMDEKELIQIYLNLALRAVTGNAAREWLSSLMDSMTVEGQYLLRLLIDRKVGDGVGESITLKIFPVLFHTPMYSRCSLMSPKIKDAFDSMEFFYCQQKMDGSFCWATKDNNGESALVTRAGNYYPSWISDKILQGIPSGNAIAGELLVYKDGEILNRQTGNGILNSILSGDYETARHAEYEYRMTAWDSITYDEFFIYKESKHPYKDRLDRTLDLVISAPNMLLVETTVVKSLEEAYLIYGKYLLEGKEGCIIKSPDGVLKDNTSKDNVKLKLSFEIDLSLEQMHHGEKGTKYENMLGSMTLSSSDGLLVSGCGTGLTDAQRDFSLYTIGEIITVKANDIISRDGSDILSLNLPVFIESRKHDKTVADSLPHIYAQREAARMGAKSA